MAEEISHLRQNPEYFALYVGGHEARKNVAGVFRAMQAYWSQYDPTFELRLTGSPEGLSGEAAQEYKKLPQDAPVRFLGDPIDDELAQQYASATLLLMLSHEEGFGLPVLEAMAHGCPVVAANQSSLPEVVGDAGLLVNPKHPSGVADSMHWLIGDTQRQEEYATRGIRRAAAFSWNLAATRMREVYKSVLSGGHRKSSSERAEPQLSTSE
jgi:alpha-1,3-rhamnosyl/mannosyltransferase